MSTRIIVKNLPHNITPTRLEAHFSSSHSGNAFFQGTVTDAKVVTDPKSGKSRGFAFIGYRTAQDAIKAVEWFNGTFVDMRKISAGDDSLGQSWRDKNKEFATRKRKAQMGRDEDKSKRPKRDVEDEKKAELVKELTGSKKKNKLLAHNLDLEKTENAVAPKTQETPAQDQAKRERRPKKRTRSQSKPKEDEKITVVEAMNVVEVVHDDSVPQIPDTGGDVGPQPVSDIEWLRARTSRTLGLASDSEESDHEDREASDNEPSPSDDETPHQSEVENTPATPPATDPSDSEQYGPSNQSTADSKILKTGRLFVRNLVYGVTEDDLRNIFSPYGEIEEIHIPLGNNHEPLPLAFVQFTVTSDALRAFKELDGTDLQGRLLHIIPGDTKRVPKDEVLEGKTLKQRREIERRKQAGRGGDWGTLFMNQDAVLSSLATRYGVAKSDLLLDPGSTTDPAVKAAMAETTILTETRVYLLEHGVNVASFTSSQKSRSDNVIIAKNFPYGTTNDELVVLFGGTDIVKRVLLPPAGTIAFIEFYDSGQARASFKRLAYRRFKDVPLYLEKAPEGIFTAEPTRQLEGAETKKGSNDLTTEPSEPDSTLFIKNLDFSTSQTALEVAFKKFRGFRLAVLKTKPPNARGERLSMGFGFVTFQSKEMASAAMNAGVTLDGRKLEIKFARQGVSEVKSVTSTKSAGGRKKIVIKNLGFNASKRDLRELFGTYGHIQSLRLPRKFDNTPRGFAFIEFSTASDARNAMESLKHTHLLGRHLVLEWAEEEEGPGSVEKMRRRVREGVQAGEVGEMMGLNTGGRIGDILENE